MPIENRLKLTGQIVSALKQNRSPLGILNSSFWLEHQSKQIEAGLERRVWCKIQVVLNGNQFSLITQQINLGKQVSVEGFLHSHKDYNGLNQLVLHAERIEFIDQEKPNGTLFPSS
ncbi:MULTISPECIES: primosomal replication protein N [Actinobacillus]|uniref:Replication restart protein PriB n=3 Tax=Actinobacillus TaxID=713 RepID=C5RZJ8_9PAST|nr:MULTISPECIES: primosomal replication protein N [Actinobacillus]AWI50082.1 primosomal replication protein N [Actinobacillus porcitonsillarum]EER47853.1 primosomal replication protein N [Actinobacillus minor NM305]EEV25249.1 primosomal replication protein N [Actinobacillus minor 202]MDD6910660.1 primosomal replication protein N [Actinobacillus minor]MDY4714215.1 primosomal replication protein N [Actinobacillus minor]